MKSLNQFVAQYLLDLQPFIRVEDNDLLEQICKGLRKILKKVACLGSSSHLDLLDHGPRHL